MVLIPTEISSNSLYHSNLLTISHHQSWTKPTNAPRRYPSSPNTKDELIQKQHSSAAYARSVTSKLDRSPRDKCTDHLIPQFLQTVEDAVMSRPRVYDLKNDEELNAAYWEAAKGGLNGAARVSLFNALVFIADVHHSLVFSSRCSPIVFNFHVSGMRISIRINC